MIGYAAIFMALVTTGIATFCYLNAHMASSTRRSAPRLSGSRDKGLFYYRLSALFIVITALYLFYIIVNDQFQFAYVFGYSSRDLSLIYKLSAFWAGQEGSFLLWALFHVGFGLVLARKKQPCAMAVYAGIQIMLLSILLVKSPFMMLAEPRADGFGLNPLLQDPWMVVHPPVLFLGYAGLAVPFACAIDGIMTGRHKNWVSQALPWALFAWAALGAGIFLGGFWAYKVLGWGGYWGWDPVENSSLVPWLATGAMVHLLLLARVRLAAVKPAGFAALFTFVLVMYGTFLTRSGMLSDFSVHSYSDEGVGGILASFVLLTAVSALSILIIRWPSLPEGELYPAVKSREFFLAATAIIFTALGIIVLVGMSTPLVGMLLGNPQNVSTAFYNTTTLPLTAALVLLLAVGSLVGWGEDSSRLFARYRWIAGIAVIAVGLAAAGGIRQLIALVTVGLAAAIVVVSIVAVRNKKMSHGAGLTHIGLAITLIGILFSSLASQSVYVSFQQGESQEVFGTNFTYTGTRLDPEGQGFYQSFSLAGEANTVLEPYTKLNKEGRPAAREPGIYRMAAADIYLAPAMQQEEISSKEMTLHKEEQKQEAGLTVKFIRYGMSGNGTGGDVRVYALLAVTKDGNTEEARPELLSRNGQMIPAPFKVFGQYELRLTAVSMKDGTATVGIKDLTAPPEQPRIDVEISRKPLINLVWLGTVFITVGTIWAGVNHIEKRGKFT
ncbi:hypothetical protein SPACI_052480 [Sporomusa acidovorans DSM 3132]|uniref:Cytochrome c-type biogenesis protein CcmF n=2 Tax=Sporomusa TaxID=2375 RepID=A0ABZ3JAR0_SPOA4|nr:cytochrome c biogenesis protein CcsA [Sporomusa acidovorans]OZC21792.1 cytochrome c-type biogenesis protein CcmF [Sporomusa acidovorans DSM 3132]SDD56752.1 cytochrome c-type biogenesis protein CcmF [Sporomusa acidovorans]